MKDHLLLRPDTKKNSTVPKNFSERVYLALAAAKLLKNVWSTVLILIIRENVEEFWGHPRR